MNTRAWISVAVMFVLLMMIGYVVHGMLLAPDYAQVPNLYRSPEQQMAYFPFMLPAHLLVAITFVWIYVRIKDGKPFLAQGIRYGLVIAALTIMPKFLIYFSIQPIPGSLAFKQIMFDTIGLIVMGIAVARLNK